MTKMVKVTRKKQRHIPGYIIVCVVICILCFSPQAVTMWKTNQAIKALETQKSQLLLEKEHNKDSVRNLRSNETVEKMAREELGMIKPGEKVLVEVVTADKAVQ